MSAVRRDKNTLRAENRHISLRFFRFARIFKTPETHDQLPSDFVSRSLAVMPRLSLEERAMARALHSLGKGPA